jgi:hypothetical protein
MYEYAISLGVKFTFGARVTEYFETERSAGIVINGQKHEGDFVIGADGVHSKARNFVTKKEERPQNSGFAVFRCWFELDSLLGNPKTEWIAKSPKDLILVWIGHDTHAIITTNVKMRSITCFATHKDNSDAEESWNLPGKGEDMLAGYLMVEGLLLLEMLHIPIWQLLGQVEHRQLKMVLHLGRWLTSMGKQIFLLH